MGREVSVRDLRNRTAEVVAAVRAGERLSLTINRVPVADIVPHAGSRTPWAPAHVLREIVEDAPADTGLLRDLAAIRGSLLTSREPRDRGHLGLHRARGWSAARGASGRDRHLGRHGR